MITSLNRHTTIPHPDAPSEFEIQSALYQSLLSLGYHVHAEVTANSPDSGTRAARLDLVIYRRAFVHYENGGLSPVDTPVALIEVKRQRTAHTGLYARKTAERASQQYQRYARYGIPVIVCQGQSQIGPTLDQIRTLLNTETKEA